MRTIIITEGDRADFIRRIQVVPLGKKKFVAEFKIYRVKRSLRANGLYRLWLYCIKDETGNDENTLHVYFKKKYLPWIIKEVFDTEVSIIPSTKNLDSKQFSDYMNQIKAEMLEQGIFLPEPQDQGWDEFYLRYGLN
jgi:hypothetical protein